MWGTAGGEGAQQKQAVELGTKPIKMSDIWLEFRTDETLRASRNCFAEYIANACALLIAGLLSIGVALILRYGG